MVKPLDMADEAGMLAMMRGRPTSPPKPLDYAESETLAQMQRRQPATSKPFDAREAMTAARLRDGEQAATAAVDRTRGASSWKQIKPAAAKMPAYKVGDTIRYRHPGPDFDVEGRGKILSSGRDGCVIKTPLGWRARIRHEFILSPPRR